jgi:hypothetical protein
MNHGQQKIRNQIVTFTLNYYNLGIKGQMNSNGSGQHGFKNIESHKFVDDNFSIGAHIKKL